MLYGLVPFVSQSSDSRQTPTHTPEKCTFTSKTPHPEAWDLYTTPLEV